MARSQLLKDIVGGIVDLESILLRIKVITSDLKNELINNWIDGELKGFGKTEELPSYRVIDGHPVGSFLVNNSVKYTKAPVPLEHLLSQEEIKEIRTVNVTDGISTLIKVLNNEKDSSYGKNVPTSYCHSISTYALQIIGIDVVVPQNLINEIVSNVRAKLLEVVMELEKQFDDLDSLDISSQLEGNVSKIEQVTYNIENIIFDDSIRMGDKNKVKGSMLGHLFGGKRD